MNAGRPVGIRGHGAYVPRYRLPAEEIAAQWNPGRPRAPVRRKAVAGMDEDVVTMAIAAARVALRRAALAPETIGAVWIGTESKPYAVKPSSTIVASALGITPWTLAADFEFACKAGTEALRAAMALVGSGGAEAALAIGMDTAQARPGDALEATAGSGGAAYIVSPAEESVAVFDGALSYVTDTPDFFRREGQHYPEHAGRFTGEPAYFAHTLAASRALLEKLGADSRDFRHAVFHQPVPKFARRAARELGFSPEQIDTGLVATEVGNTYAGATPLGLAAVLDVAEPGDRIFACSYGSGAGSDAFALTVTDRIVARREGPTVRDLLARREDIDYGTYLRLRDMVART